MLLTHKTAYETAMVVCVKPVKLSGCDTIIKKGCIVEVVQRMRNDFLFIGSIADGYTIYLPYNSFELLVGRPAYARKV